MGQYLPKHTILIGFQVIVEYARYSRDALDEDHRSYVISHSAKEVDAYMIFVANADDIVEARHAFVRDHDQRIVSHQFHATKWAHRKGHTDRRCEYDAWKKAFDAMEQANGSLATVNWAENELEVLAKHELRSLKPVIYVVDVPREAYMRQVLPDLDESKHTFFCQIGVKKPVAMRRHKRKCSPDLPNFGSGLVLSLKVGTRTVRRTVLNHDVPYCRSVLTHPAPYIVRYASFPFRTAVPWSGQYVTITAQVRAILVIQLQKRHSVLSY